MAGPEPGKENAVAADVGLSKPQKIPTPQHDSGVSRNAQAQEINSSAGPSDGQTPAQAQSTEINANLTPAEREKFAQIAADVKTQIEAYATIIENKLLDPPLTDAEQTVLDAFDALTPEQQKLYFWGTPDKEGAKVLAQMKALMNTKLKELATQAHDADLADEVAKTGKKKRLPGKRFKILGGAAKAGQRDRDYQAKLFFRKVMSVGAKGDFYKTEPIWVDKNGEVLPPDVKPDPKIHHKLNLKEWREPKYIVHRMLRALKESALPTASRHHWGTDVDIESAEAEDWAAPTQKNKDGGSHYRLGQWLDEQRAVLGLKTTYSGPREREKNPIAPGDKPKGYHDERWHLTMSGLGKALHRRHQMLMDDQAKKARNESILEAFDLWWATYGNQVKVLPAPPKGHERMTKKEARDNFRKDTKDALEVGLTKIRIEDYTGSVNPDVRPK